MSLSKLNVMHWHLVDDDSFPLNLESFPSIPENAAFSEDRVYTHQMVQEVVEYAETLGIRVVPEFDNPGHVRAIGMDPAFNAIIRCYNKDWPSTIAGAYKINGGPPTGVLDPSSDLTY